jgi:hypothetical protein
LQWICRLNERWANPASLQVLGYYDSRGGIIANAIDSATNELRPIDDGLEASRLPEGVRFAKVCLSLDY